jgi:hypothetical protein
MFNLAFILLFFTPLFFAFCPDSSNGSDGLMAKRDTGFPQRDGFA